MQNVGGKPSRAGRARQRSVLVRLVNARARCVRTRSHALGPGTAIADVSRTGQTGPGVHAMLVRSFSVRAGGTAGSVIRTASHGAPSAEETRHARSTGCRCVVCVRAGRACRGVVVAGKITLYDEPTLFAGHARAFPLKNNMGILSPYGAA